jgi:O-antigen ligase
MKSRALRFWIIAALTPALAAGIIRLAWEITRNPHPGSLAIIIALMIAISATYALLLYLTIKPSLKKLKSLPVVITATVIAVGGVIGCIIHFFRYISSPKANSFINFLLAGILLASALAICGLILWVFWRLRKGKEV